jgi:hypothetical protein
MEPEGSLLHSFWPTMTRTLCSGDWELEWKFYVILNVHFFTILCLQTNEMHFTFTFIIYSSAPTYVSVFIRPSSGGS